MSMVGSSRRWVVSGLLVAAALVMTGTAPPSPAGAAVAHIRGAGARSAIPGSYIVMLKGSPHPSGARLNAEAKALAKAYHGALGSVWPAFNGFSVHLSADHARELAADPAVDYVAQDQLRAVSPRLASAQPSGRTAALMVTPAALQQNAPAGLDRIDQMEPVDDDGAPALDGKYAYDDVAGQGAGVYVLGAGVNVGLADFGGRVDPGPNFVNDGGSSATDCPSALSTKIADIIGGTVFGVAKQVSMVSLRMAKCIGFETADYLAAVNWVIEFGVTPAVIYSPVSDFCVDRDTLQIQECPPDVAAADVAVDNAAYDHGYLMIDGAGDALSGGVGQNVCNKATRAAPHTLYVGATGIDPATHRDQLAGFSDFGPCVTMYAPGVDIQTAAGAMSSSLAAAAFVAGTAALFLAKPEFVNATPAKIATELVTNRSTSPATVGHPVIEGLGADSHDRMLYTGPPGFFTIDDVIGLAPGPDGRLQMTGVNGGGRMFTRTQDQPGSSGWGPWTQSATTKWSTITGGVNGDGRLALAGLTATGQIFTRNQSAPSITNPPQTPTWLNWHQADGTLTHIALARQGTDAELFGTNAQGQAFYRSQTAAGKWGPWSSFAVPGKVSAITAVTTASSRIEAFMLDDSGRVWHTTQTSANADTWGPITKLDGLAVVDIAAALNQDGRVELIGLDSGGNAWRRPETSAGSDVWTPPWAQLPAKTLAHLAVATNPLDGRVQVDAVDPLGHIWQSAQQQANAAGYTTWTSVDGQLRS